MTTRRKVILIITALIALAVIAGAVILSLQGDTSGVYRKSFERAELYYKEGDYRQAALKYREAIEANPDAVEAYEGLAYSYIQAGDLVSARDAAGEGYDRTGSDTLSSLVAYIEGGRYGVFAPKESADSLINIEPVLDDRLLSRIGTTTYGSYRYKASPLSKTPQSDGSVEVVFAEIPGTLIFRNSSSQPEAVQGPDISDDALPEEVRLDNIASSLFGKVPLTKEELDDLGAANITGRQDAALGRCLVFMLGGCSFTVSCDESETIQANANNSIVPVNAIQNIGVHREEGIPMVGNIIDAQTGKPVSGVTLRFYGDGESGGDPLEECETDSDGNYETNLPPGTYTVEVSGDGYITESEEIQIGTNDSKAQEDFIITKELAEGEARIVLEWGATPTDLDSHLIGTTDSGKDFHIFFGDKSCSDSEGTVADLDLDDTTSYGPETTTIYNLNGRYEFWVHDYTPSTGNIEDSGAKITVYLPDQSSQSFDTSDGDISGNWWYICTIDHGRLEVDSSHGSMSSDASESTETSQETASNESGDELMMEDVDIPYGYYTGYMSQGDGAIDTDLQLNEDMTYRLHCIFSIFKMGEPCDSDGDYTYTGTYRVSGYDSEERPVLDFENDVQDFSMTARFQSGGVYLSCSEYVFYVTNY